MISTAVFLPLLAFVAAAAVLTVTPGVDTAMVLRSAAAQGWRAGAAAGLGICAGLLMWGVAAAFGLTAILSASETAFTVLKWLSAAYLAYLGLKLLLKPRSTLDAAQSTAELRGKPPVTEAFRRGFLTNMLNPKVGIFYITFLPQFIPAGANVAAFSLLLAVIHVTLTLAWFSLLITLTIPLGRHLAKPAVVKALDRLTGCVFLAFGAKLAASHRG